MPRNQRGRGNGNTSRGNTGGGRRASQNRAALSPVTKGTLLLIVGAVVVACAVFAMLFFGMKGSTLMDRCYCSMTKVIAYTVIALVSVAAQLVFLFLFDNTCDTYRKAGTNILNVTAGDRMRAWRRESRTLLTMWPVLIAAVLGAIGFLGVTWLIDQNHNFLWLFYTNYQTVNVLGILSAAVTFLGSWLLGLFAALIVKPSEGRR